MIWNCPSILPNSVIEISAHVESIHARVITTHVVDPNSRTANRLNRKNVEERQRRRAQSQPFKFEGDSKHLILQFTVTVTKRNGERLSQFERSGIEGSLYYRVGDCVSQQAPNSAGKSPSECGNSFDSERASQADGSVSIIWRK